VKFAVSLSDAERANAARIETIWASVDRLSMQERATAAQAAKQGGATQRYIDEKIFGMTPAEMRQAQQDRDDELLIAQVAA
jgi:hypothetical protein